jgi:hypothetical protein
LHWRGRLIGLLMRLWRGARLRIRPRAYQGECTSQQRSG